jgi:glycoprotein endo-alpha-1,2-mannosidase
VGPGYIDTRIRPWNAENTRARQNGKYYDQSFQAAIKQKPDFIGITSFNEWHEGTQIEPAVPKSIPGYTYEDYSPLDPEYYLERTSYWVQQYINTD